MTIRAMPVTLIMQAPIKLQLGGNCSAQGPYRESTKFTRSTANLPLLFLLPRQRHPRIPRCSQGERERQ